MLIGNVQIRTDHLQSKTRVEIKEKHCAAHTLGKKKKTKNGKIIVKVEKQTSN